MTAEQEVLQKIENLKADLAKAQADLVQVQQANTDELRVFGLTLSQTKNCYSEIGWKGSSPELTVWVLFRHRNSKKWFVEVTLTSEQRFSSFSGDGHTLKEATESIVQKVLTSQANLNKFLVSLTQCGPST